MGIRAVFVMLVMSPFVRSRITGKTWILLATKTWMAEEHLRFLSAGGMGVTDHLVTPPTLWTAMVVWSPGFQTFEAGGLHRVAVSQLSQYANRRDYVAL